MNSTRLLVFFCLLPFFTSAQKNKVVQTASGLKYQIIKKGSGSSPVRGDMVSVYYTSRLANDSIINKYDTTTGPMSFLLGEGEIIKGIDEAVFLLNPGGKIHVEIPPQLAYGNRKIGKIPAGSTIITDLELTGFSPAFFHPLNKDTLTLSLGLKKLIVKETKEALPKITNDVTFNFTAYYFNENGERKIFDKSAPDQKLTFQLGGSEMITGLDLGLRTVRKGEKATFIISPALAYKNEKRGILPPNTTIYLDVELLAFSDPFFQVTNNDTVTTTSGLKYLVIKKGTGKLPGRNDIASVRFTGYIIDSAGNRIIFDRVAENKSWNYRIGSKNILQGLNEGISAMNMGAQYRLIIPPDLAFADRKIGIIEPNSNVYYDIALENITPMTFLTKGSHDTTIFNSGLRILKINESAGTRPSDSAIVFAKFTAYYLDSIGIPVIFENTQEEGKPYQFRLDRGDFIEGIKDALKQLTEGQVAKLFIPANLAYGGRGVPGVIPPNQDLIFDLQVVKVINHTE